MVRSAACWFYQVVRNNIDCYTVVVKVLHDVTCDLRTQEKMHYNIF